ncbi:fibrinogen C domain-containing protein 1 [Biomphalaria pfeifferi]|uniref:Fibrinogen C domain-containing protein 1 n=1 Tax=Biomphalaria pfeifferi TaxID=112525 RepID=A0AAD8FG02_BIOPF|nr:fibrinogen C domain-containing protein 1 [Biomphalaria pfeifferi]
MRRNIQCSIVLLILGVLVTLGSGIHVSFIARPEVGKELVKPFELSCSLQDYQGYTTDLIYILKGSSTVIAKIPTENKGDVHLYSKSFSVDGTISPGSFPYLNVTWTRPTEDLSGQYTCFIHSRNAVWVDSLYQSTVQVSIEKATFKDLFDFSATLASQLEETNSRLSFISNKMAAANAELGMLRPNVQEGTVSCGIAVPLSSAPPDPTCLPNRESRHFVRFNTTYAKAPSVTLSLTSFDINRDFNTRYYFYATNLTTEGFEVVCGTWCNTVIYGMHVRWQAVNK